MDRHERVTGGPAAARSIAALALTATFAAAPAANVAAAPWRARIGVAGLAPPRVTAASPLLALVDTPVDLTHPVFRGALLGSLIPGAPYDLHGTATAAVAAGTGDGDVLGVWPGMHIRSYPFAADDRSCVAEGRLIDRAVAGGAAVINMSYGSTEPCFEEFDALQHATRRGVVLVAAAGNDRRDGNLRSYPAAFPHVITAAALGPGAAAATFSSTSSMPSLAAPGVDVLTAVPPAFDPDGAADGWARLSGTSFSAPMVAAAAAWIRAARPALTAGQIGALLCEGADDLPPRGWDRSTGCGGLDVRATLSAASPPADPGEPNDDVRWVDGLTSGPVAAAIWRGSGSRTLRGTVTLREDPVDVYRILRPPDARVRVTLTLRAGGADLRVLGERALGVGDRASLLATSVRRGASTERVTVANRAGTSRVGYVAVLHDARGPHSAAYTLRISRAPRR